MLDEYRVLDLTDEKGLLCGRVLADLGADVIKVEPPHGCSARKIGPFYKDIPHPERSLYWFAYNLNKRGITLNLECVDGRELFRRLIETADVIIESFPPSYMKNLGLGYYDLRRIRSDIIMTSITPFGQEGPYCNFQAADLVCWSMGGFAYTTGYQDRPPVQISFPQAYLAGALEAAVGAVTALYYREVFGEGQHLDVSIQAAVAKNLMNAPLFWQVMGVNIARAGPNRVGLSVSGGQRIIWKCKDGEVSFSFFGGRAGARTNRSLVEYMDEKGAAPEFLKEMDWEGFDLTTATQEVIGLLGQSTHDFFMRHTKKELFQEAIERRMTLYPVQTVSDIMSDPQLVERGCWEEVEHPELGARLLYNGLPFLSSEKLQSGKMRAPLIGEDNEEIYLEELGLSREDLTRLAELGAV
jgi:crotonobetainyl-CoA:carnitine CoA-transferase CaiB-like acyl-CoA transferase